MKLLFILIYTISLSSCFLFPYEQRSGVSSSLVDYLYPEGTTPKNHQEKITHLKLPLTVGLAFVPTSKHSSSFPEAKKLELLEKAKNKFDKLDYVSEIIVIPDTYMKSSKGFQGVGQIARVYGLDIIALVSYDQVINTTANNASIFYWTIIGAYIIPGNSNSSTTFIDTAVFDVSSRKLLFRAPGVSEIDKLSTMVGADQTTRELQEQGFVIAMDDMTKNLETELEKFKQKIKKEKNVTISHRDGYGGGGATDWMLLLLLLGWLIVKKVRY